MSSEVKRLYRSRKDRMLAGVCGGIGEYFNLDPTLIRLVFVLLILISWGTGLIAYLVLCIIVPQEPEDVNYTPPAPEEQLPEGK